MSSSNWYKKISSENENDGLHLSPIDPEPHTSRKRFEEFFYFTAYRKYETSYYVQVVNRQIDNNHGDPYWVASASAYSLESGNVVYRKNEFYKKFSDSNKAYKEMYKRIENLRYSFGASNIPTATLSSMIWHLLHDITGDNDLSPKGENNIIYLRQDHNINENKGNLINNIVYLRNADYHFLDKRPGANEKMQYF